MQYTHYTLLLSLHWWMCEEEEEEKLETFPAIEYWPIVNSINRFLVLLLLLTITYYFLK
jgi:hypothetical protein